MEHKTIHYNAVEFGRRIRTIRKQKKMTQQELAELLFLSEESVSNFETGKLCVCQNMLSKCARYLMFLLTTSISVKIINYRGMMV